MKCTCNTVAVTEYIRAVRLPDTGLTKLQKYVGCAHCGFPVAGVKTQMVPSAKPLYSADLIKKDAPAKQMKGGLDKADWKSKLKGK